MKTEPEAKVYLDSEHYGGSDGLTKREHFASLAMQSLIILEHNFTANEIAEFAVKQADILMFELSIIQETK